MTVALDPAHPAFSFLQAVWPFDEGTGTPQELIGSAPVTVDAGSFSWVLESGRWGIHLTTADIIGLGADMFPTAPDVTIVIRKRKLDTTNRDGCAFGYAGDSGGTTRRCGGMFPNSDGQADGDPDNTLIFDFGGTTSNVSRKLISNSLSFTTARDTFVFRVNASEIRIWRNGTDIGNTSGGAPPTRVNTGANVQLNRGFAQASGDNIRVDLFAIYTGDDLTDAMCASLSSNPDAMFLSDPVFDEYGSQSRTQTSPPVLRGLLLWPAPDELATALTVAQSDETGWPLPRPLMVARIAAARPWAFSDDELPGPGPPPVLTVLVPVTGQDQFTTPRLIALVQVEGRLSAVPQPVLTVLVPVGFQSSFTVTVLSIARDANGDPVTDARARRILVPVGLDEVA